MDRWGDKLSKPALLSVCAKYLKCHMDSLFFSSPPADVHWQRGDLHEPLQVPAHLHARESGGVSQQELL